MLGNGVINNMKRSLILTSLIVAASASHAQFIKHSTVYNLGADFSGTGAQRVSDLAVIGNDIYYVGRATVAGGSATLGKISGYTTATSGANVAALGTSVLNRGTRLEAYNGNLFFGLNMGDATTHNIQYITTSGSLITGGAGVLSDGIITQAENGNNLLQGMAIDTSGAFGAGPLVGGVQLGSGGFKSINVTTGAISNINPGAGPSGNRRDVSMFSNGDYVLNQDGVIRLVSRTGASTAGVPGAQLGATGASGSFATVGTIDALPLVNSSMIIYNQTTSGVNIVDTSGTLMQSLNGSEGGSLAWGVNQLNYKSWNDGVFTWLAVSGWDSSLGNRIDIYRTAVPEPGTMAALGLGALAMMRRRKK